MKGEISHVASQDRYLWVDAAKGLSIILVVIVHSLLLTSQFAAIPTWLEEINAALLYLRMPLFFCMSGLFAAKWLLVPWKQLFSGKLALLLWAFMVWQPLIFFYKCAVSWALPSSGASESVIWQLFRLLASPARPNGESWFIWALAIFFVLAKLMRGVAPAIQLMTVGMMSMIWLGLGSTVISPEVLRLMGNGWDGLHYFFFFLMGLYLRNVMLVSARKLNAWRASALFAIGVAVYSLAASAGIVDWPIVSFLMRVVGLCSGICLGVLLSRVTILRRIGTKTLPIYLMHSLVLAIVVIIVHAFTGVITNVVVSVLTIAVAALVAVATPLYLEKRVQGVPYLELAFAAPHWFSSLFYRQRALVDMSVRKGSLP